MSSCDKITSTSKVADAKYFEIDKSKLRHKCDDTIAATAMNCSGDAVQCVKMENTSSSSSKPSELCLHGSSHLISSMTSSLADTPGDSGVLCLDSESSEATTSQALMSHSLIGAEELACDPTPSQELTRSTTSSIMTRSDIDNQNIDDIVPELLVGSQSKSPLSENLPDVILKALESEKVSSGKDNTDKASPRAGEPKKSHSEDIVYRRRCRKKSQSGPSSQKKRVSFHEDILNNTRTDNIHIERGFVSYGTDSSYCDRFRQRNNINVDRFSWCASGDQAPRLATDVAHQTMSDILTYGDSKADKSGVFEYYHDIIKVDDQHKENQKRDKDNNNEVEKRNLYGCDSNSSDSNFSCDSETSSTSSSNSNKVEQAVPRKCDKAQKSYSCDGFEENGHIAFMRKTYFSEADIDQSVDHHRKPLDVSQSPNAVKSVLKKKRYITTNVVEEQKKNNKMLKLLDANNIIDSLKSFYKSFHFNLTPEKGVPETEMNHVVEALPNEVNQYKNISKSLDSGLQIDDEDDFVEINLNENAVEKITLKEKQVQTPNTEKQDESPRRKLTLNMKNGKSTNNHTFPAVNKYVVNCESMVYEHKGVSYNYVHDSFQTSFDAPKQNFVPLPDTSVDMAPSTSKLPMETPTPMEIDNSSKVSTPKRQFKKIELDPKTNTPKHLSSPKKQNISHYSRKFANLQTSVEEIPQACSDSCSNTDNSTVKGDDFLEDYFDSPANYKLLTHKSALLNRYLKNVYQKKDLELKIKYNKFFQSKLRLDRKFPSIIYPWKDVSKNFHVSADRMARLINKEVIENKRLSVRLLTADEPSYFDSFEDNVAVECSEKLRLQIFSYPNETLNRMMKVQSPYNLEDGSWVPLLVFITDYALYVATVQPGGTEYNLLCRLPHDELDAIAVGPESQYVQVVDVSGNIACSIVTAEASLGARFASSLEWSARTSPLRPSRPPALISLTYRQLASSVAKLRLEKQISRVFFYGHACSGESGERAYAPDAFAPPLEGYLMCRTDTRKRFEPSYFLLRAGILHWGPQPDVTPHSVELRSVVGVRRYCDASRRPHCFEIALPGDRLLMAAPDESVASSWLQSLLLHAAQALEENNVMKTSIQRSGVPPPACTVLVTHKEVVSLRDTMDPAFVVGLAPYFRNRGDEALLREYITDMRSDVDILSCGSIKNLSAFKIPDSDENWCCLEWSVCEAPARGACTSLVFASGAELERFISSVERAFCSLTNEPFPLSVVDGCKVGCGAAHAKYEGAWSHMLPAQH